MLIQRGRFRANSSHSGLSSIIQFDYMNDITTSALTRSYNRIISSLDIYDFFIIKCNGIKLKLFCNKNKYEELKDKISKEVPELYTQLPSYITYGINFYWCVDDDFFIYLGNKINNDKLLQKLKEDKYTPINQIPIKDIKPQEFFITFDSIIYYKANSKDYINILNRKVLRLWDTTYVCKLSKEEVQIQLLLTRDELDDLIKELTKL